jgi:hypothetical protein
VSLIDYRFMKDDNLGVANLYLLFFLISVGCLIAGLIRPRWVKMPSRKRASAVFGIASILFFVLVGTSANSSSSTTAPASDQVTASSSAQTVPTPSTPEQALQSAVQSSFTDKGTLDVTYKAGTIEDDDSPPFRPASSPYVTIDVNVSSFLGDDTFISDSGTLAATIFKNVFPLDPHYYDVLVRYYGATIDQYGNSSNSMMMSYEMDRQLFNKINWSGFSDVGNDVHLCAFLREQAVLQEISLTDEQKAHFYLGCVVMLSDLRTAEDKVEKDNPQQCGDIPQYGN